MSRIKILMWVWRYGCGVAAGLTGQDFLITIEVRINTASLDNTQQPHARCSGWTNILDRCIYRNV